MSRIEQTPNASRRARAENRRQGRRQLVVIWGRLAFIAVPAGYAARHSSFLLTRLNIIALPWNGWERMIVLAAIVAAFSVGALAGHLVFEFIMSYYLTIPEWLQLHPERGYLNPAGNLVAAVEKQLFHWKIQREARQVQISGIVPLEKNVLRAKEICLQLDGCADNFTFPMLDHGYVYLADTRLSAYRDERNWALIIEVLGYHPRAGGLGGMVNSLYCFGSCLRRVPGLSNEDFLHLTREVSDDDPIFQDDESWQVREGAHNLQIRDNRVTLDLSPAALARKGIALAEPPTLTAAELLRSLIPEQRTLLLATDAELYQRLTVPLPLVLRLDEWHHPDLSRGELPSQSETFRQIAAVLASGDTALYRPTQAPNTHWRNWPAGGTL